MSSHLHLMPGAAVPKVLCWCLLCKEPKVPSHVWSAGVVFSPRWVIIQNNPRHMTLIKPERQRGDIHKQRHVFPAERGGCFKLTAVTKQNNQMINFTYSKPWGGNMFVVIVERRGKELSHKRKCIVVETMGFIAKNDWNIHTYANTQMKCKSYSKN